MSAPKPEITVHDVKVISQADYYHGWPTIARRKNGELLLVYSGGREDHVCPYGRVEIMHSADNGAAWQKPEVLANGPLDDRDAGVLETREGTLLVNWFTSAAWRRVLKNAEERSKVTPAMLKWKKLQQLISLETIRNELGLWMIRSGDGGKTWSEKYPSVVNSPHGPIQLTDGRLLYAGKATEQQLTDAMGSGHKAEIGVAESRDDGRSWQWLAAIPAAPGHDLQQYHELHLVECETGKLVAQIRNHNEQWQYETLQTESVDGGRTWSVPHSIGVWGLPSHLLRLKDGRLLMTHGHRRPPFGNQVRVSADHGATWSEALIISGDGIGIDLGYPSTVELDDGTLLTVWYELLANNPSAVLRQARWSLKAFG